MIDIAFMIGVTKVHHSVHAAARIDMLRNVNLTGNALGSNIKTKYTTCSFRLGFVYCLKWIGCSPMMVYLICSMRLGWT